MVCNPYIISGHWWWISLYFSWSCHWLTYLMKLIWSNRLPDSWDAIMSTNFLKTLTIRISWASMGYHPIAHLWGRVGYSCPSWLLLFMPKWGRAAHGFFFNKFLSVYDWQPFCLPPCLSGSYCVFGIGKVISRSLLDLVFGIHDFFKISSSGNSFFF
jgi:hypothetical protein